MADVYSAFAEFVVVILGLLAQTQYWLVSSVRLPLCQISRVAVNNVKSVWCVSVDVEMWRCGDSKACFPLFCVSFLFLIDACSMYVN